METAPSPTFGDTLKRARVAAGLTQEELAERSGVSARSIRNLERGTPHRPRKDTLTLLATALGLSPMDQANFLAMGRQPGAARADTGTSTAEIHQHPRSHLPIPPTALIGREHEAQTACALLRRPEVRLLTLCGPPGVGKTRLGLAVAAQLQPAFADGAVFVPLAPISDPGLVVPAIAQALGVHESTADVLTERLQQKVQAQALLLLLDNFEQVTSAALVLADLLATCPQLKILVTSRVAVHVRGEYEFTLRPLALPDLAALPTVEMLAYVPSVALLLQRVQAVLPSFALTPANAAAFAAICHRLDGLPLALELAATRLKFFSPQALLAQLEERRLALTGGARDLPKHQQTLRETLAWSYDLLQEEERALFRRLAIFVGGCPLEAVAPVCLAAGPIARDLFEVLSTLSDHHLLRAEEVGRGREVHLSMLETIREYALEQLQAHAEVGATQQAHAHYYLRLAESAARELTGSQQALWFERLARERENLRAALQWARDADEVELGLNLSAGLFRFWHTCGSPTEGLYWLDTFIARTCPDAPVRQTERWGKALNGAGYLAAQQGDYERAEQYHREDLALCRALGIGNGVVAALNNLGIALLKQEKFAETLAAWEESLAIARALGDTRRVALTLNNMGCLAYAQGQYRRAAQFYEESLAMRRQVEDAYGIASTLDNWGQLACEQGEYALAVVFLEEALRISRTLEAKLRMAGHLSNLGRVAYEQGGLERAEALCAESLGISQAQGEEVFRPGALGILGKVAYLRGTYERATGLHEESLALCRSMRDKQGAAEALADLGRVAQAQGASARAACYYAESLKVYQTLHTAHRLSSCLEGVAAMLAASGHAEPVARFLGAAAALRTDMGAPLPPVERATYERLAVQISQELGEERFSAAWTAGQALALEELMKEALHTAGTQEGLSPSPV